MDYIGPISSAVMAIVWIIYFQVFFIQYKRNNRPYLVIHHAQNENPDALCLLVNMGKETVHVQCVQVVIFTRAGEVGWRARQPRALPDIISNRFC